jgi:diguanylate cyclase (GGDEF)-like protein
MDRLEHALARAHRRKTSLTMVFLDLDDFKVINDSLGYDTGDRLLEEVGRRLDSAAKSSDTVARLGGDESVVLLEDIGDEREVSLVAERIKKKFEAPFKVGRRELSVTASIGVAVGTRGGPRELLRNADVAMYRAKESSKNRHEVYDTGAPVRRDGRSRGHVRA